MSRTEIIHELPNAGKRIAITFDDGPDPVFTQQILEVFRQAGAKATFFMIGGAMAQHPDIVQQVLAQGHEIGNHTYTHPFLTQIGPEQRGEELQRTHRLIEELTGSPPTAFRPPFFDYDEDVAREVAVYGYRVFGAANGEARDWEAPGTSHIVEQSRACIRDGAVWIFHDGYGDRTQTVEAVRILVPELIAQGYQLVTASELANSVS